MKIEYNNLYCHFVLTTLHRLPLISETNRDRIEKYITGIVKNNDSQLYAIYANPEHVHFLISRSPKISEETIASIVAESTQRFINQNKLCNNQFAWQESASAFSVSKSDVDRVCKYILNQPKHHRKVSFLEEYDEFIKFYQKTLFPSLKNPELK
jgi:REP element-mobilizing transposase RayT